VAARPVIGKVLAGLLEQRLIGGERTGLLSFGSRNGKGARSRRNQVSMPPGAFRAVVPEIKTIITGTRSPITKVMLLFHDCPTAMRQESSFPVL